MLRLLAVVALSAAVSPVDARSPIRREIQIGGIWDSTYGEVKLTQTGNQIRGEYQCCGGGTVEGYLRGSEVRFHWREPRGAGEGEGIWRMQRDGSLQGSWGRIQSDSDGAAWNLWRPRRATQLAQ